MTDLTCPACGAATPPDAKDCPGCHLSVELFAAVQEAAGGSTSDPSYIRTIGEILSAVDLTHPAAPMETPALALLSRPSRFPAPVPPHAPAIPVRTPEPVRPILELPALPAATSASVLKRQVDEYFQLGRRAGLDFTDFKERAGAAMLTDDVPSLEVLSRDLFVHLTAALTDDYEAISGRRNELAQLIATPTPDVEIEAARTALGRGDLVGAQRRLRHVSEELGRLEEEWEVVQILTTEADLLAETIRDLGQDPTPALGPLIAGRALVSEGRRAEAEQMLARASIALWSVLQPVLVRDLLRLKELILDLRGSGNDIEPAVEQLRALTVELRKRNFVGTVVAYRRLKVLVDHGASEPEGNPIPVLAPELRARPSD
ncbi:MAG: zinc ribbon domain-containing protein [Thermoplasmata archaeon]